MSGETAPEVAFRSLRREDFALVDHWFAQPHVAEWWPEHDLGIDAEASFGPAVDGREPTDVFVVECAGRAVGLVQRCALADYPEYAAALGRADGATIDYLIGEPDMVGVGIGPVLVDRFTARTFDDLPGVDEVVVSVQQGNRRSWRALEKGGFTRVFAGMVESGDPSDRGPSYVYVRRRR